MFVRLCEVSPDFSWDTRDSDIAKILKFVKQGTIGSWRGGNEIKQENLNQLKQYLKTAGVSQADRFYVWEGEKLADSLLPGGGEDTIRASAGAVRKRTA